MHIMGSVRLTFANALRVVHIALWLTIPTVFWLWLVKAEPPVDRCIYHCCTFCHENVLGISFFSFLFIAIGLFLVGTIMGACWICGYFVEIVFRVIRGDSKLPSVQWGVIGAGWGLIKSSLRYWLPFVAVFLAAYAIRAEVYPWDFRSPVLDTLPLIAALVVFWGYLVGLARYAAFGEHTLLYRRRESMRLALTKLRAALALTGALIAVTSLCVAFWSGVAVLPIPWRRLDLMTQAALGSFAFFLLLLCWAITCSHLVARYARQIGIGDHLNPSAVLDKQ